MSTNTLEQLTAGVIMHGPDILEHCICVDDIKQYVQRLDQEHLNYPIPPQSINIENWFIPKEYKNLDIEKYIIDKCPRENLDRARQELEIYRRKNMLDLLKTIKYIVDTLRANNVIWGVGRGSSVASYVLFLLEIHKIDSVKYNLPIEEFFKEI